MAIPTKKPKNRFLPGAHVSEATLARILFCWLNGDLYSEIPDTVQQKDAAVHAAIDDLKSLLGVKFSLAENKKVNISRQACHSIITEISLQIIARAYMDRISRLETLLNDGDPSLKKERRRVIALIGHELSMDEKVALIEGMKCQSVEDFVVRWGKIVLILSANVVPYEAMRAIPGVKPFDLIQNPIILSAMQKRYRRFRGYKIPALKTHIGHYFCLRDGADYLLREEGGPANEELQIMTEAEKSAYWSRCVTGALACLLLQLQTGLTYSQMSRQLN